MKKGKNEFEFVEMDCPVCGEHHFELPDVDDKKAYQFYVMNYEDGMEYCSHCGWIYDLNQTRNPDSEEGFNEMSLNEYRKWYKDILAKNPDYDYSESFDEEEEEVKKTPHLCPVCGKYEFESELSFDICPYCGWEDDGTDKDGEDAILGPNPCSCPEYKRRYEKKIQKNPKYKWADQMDD